MEETLEMVVRFTGGVAVDQVPLEGAEMAIGGPGMRRLDCDELQIELVRQGGLDRGQDARDTGGRRLERVTAKGRVFAEAVMAGGGLHFLAGQRLVYDASGKVVWVTEGEGVAATLDQMQFSEVRWEMGTGVVEATPVGQSVLAGP